MSCCEDPKPRISQASGRLFCGSCKRYLDSPPTAPKLEDDDGSNEPEARESGDGRSADDR